MAAAGLEAIGVYLARLPRGGITRSRRCGTPTGPSAPGPARPFATGGAAAAILRLGYAARASRRHRQGHQGRPAPRGRLVQGRRAAGPLEQLPRSCGPCSCSTSSPTSTACSAFVARCRKSDGSYSSTPGGEGRPRRHLPGHDHHLLVAPAHGPARRSSRRPASRRWSTATRSTGWEGDKQLWSAKDGVLIGRSPRPGPQRVPGDHPALWRLRPLAQLPAGRRPGEQRRPVPQRPHPGPRDVGLPGRHRRRVLGCPL